MELKPYDTISFMSDNLCMVDGLVASSKYHKGWEDNMYGIIYAEKGGLLRYGIFKEYNLEKIRGAKKTCNINFFNIKKLCEFFSYLKYIDVLEEATTYDMGSDAKGAYQRSLVLKNKDEFIKISALLPCPYTANQTIEFPSFHVESAKDKNEFFKNTEERFVTDILERNEKDVSCKKDKSKTPALNIGDAYTLTFKKDKGNVIELNSI